MEAKTEITSVDLNLQSTNGVKYSLGIDIKNNGTCSVFGVSFLSSDVLNVAQRLCAAIESHR
jgi:hypothetical protein